VLIQTFDRLQPERAPGWPVPGAAAVAPEVV